MDIDIISILNYTVGLVGTIALIWARFNSVKQKKIEKLEDERKTRDNRSISNLYTKYDDLVDTVKKFKEKIADNYWNRDDIKGHLAVHNETVQTKLDHMGESITEIKVMIQAQMGKPKT